MSTDKKAHWDGIYAERDAAGVSWYQEVPLRSLRLMDEMDLASGLRALDVGGGASTLVDHLLNRGLYADVLDLSAEAFRLSQARLGAAAKLVRWIQVDICGWQPEPKAYHLWHDRAVFHFLTTAKDKAAYAWALDRGLAQEGRVILATFAPDGPEECSGLPVCRYDAVALLAALGPGFELLKEVEEEHSTPWKTVQKFRYFVLKRKD